MLILVLLIAALLLFLADASGRVRATINLSALGWACIALVMLLKTT